MDIEFILEKNISLIDVIYENENNETALREAVQKSNEKFLSLLLKNSIKVKKNKKGDLALYSAIEQDDAQFCISLIKRGDKISIESFNGKTPFDIVQQKLLNNQNEETSKSLFLLVSSHKELYSFALKLNKSEKWEEDISTIFKLKKLQKSDEYLLCTYLIDNLDNELVQNLLVTKILIEYNYKILRQYLNEQLGKTKKIPKLRKSIRNVIKTQFEKNYRPFLCTIVEEGHSKIIDYFLGALQNDIDSFEYILTQTFRCSNKTVLNCVINNNNDETVKQLLKASLKLKPITFITKVLLFQEINSPLITATIKGYTKIIEILLNFVKENTPYFGDGFLMKFLTDFYVGEEITAMIKKNEYDSVKCIVNWAKVNLEENIFTNLIYFDWDNKHGINIDQVHEMMEFVKHDPDTLEEFVLDSDFYGNTILSKLIENNFFHIKITEFVKTLCETIANTEVRKDLAILSVYSNRRPDKNIEKLLDIVECSEMRSELELIKNKLCDIEDDRASLDDAIQNGDIYSMRKMWRKFSDKRFKEISLIKDCTGASLLYEAAIWGQNEIVDKLFANPTEFSSRILEEIVVKVNDFDEETPLHVAVRLGHKKFVLKLLNYIKTHLGETILRKVLLTPSQYTMCLMYEPRDEISNEKNCAKPIKYTFNW